MVVSVSGEQLPVGDAVILHLPERHLAIEVTAHEPRAVGVPGEAGDGGLGGCHEAGLPGEVEVCTVEVTAPVSQWRV